MNTTTWRVVQLVKSLPPEEQEAVRSFLACKETAPQVELIQAHPVAAWEAEEGLPDDDPFFETMNEIERERSRHVSRPTPDLD